MYRLPWDRNQSSAHSAALYPARRPSEPQKDTQPTPATEIDLTDDLPPHTQKMHHTINLSFSRGFRNSAESCSKTVATNHKSKTLGPFKSDVPHPRPRNHRRGSRAGRQRAIVSRSRIRPPIQKVSSPEMTRRDERAALPWGFAAAPKA